MKIELDGIVGTSQNAIGDAFLSSFAHFYQETKNLIRDREHAILKSGIKTVFQPNGWTPRHDCILETHAQAMISGYPVLVIGDLVAVGWLDEKIPEYPVYRITEVSTNPLAFDSPSSNSYKGELYGVYVDCKVLRKIYPVTDKKPTVMGFEIKRQVKE